MEALLWLTLTANITTSYTAWCLLTLRILGKLKNPLLYLSFPVSILSVMLAAGSAVYSKPQLLLAILVALALYFTAGRLVDWKIILVPLPLVTAIVILPLV
ncbi:MAG: hypothetical protein OWQ48_02400 [Desulfurococcus sp.]|nr:hypothetical protein [Desulfurococcus sp.]